MDSASFDKFIAWNDQLAALIAAGVPLDVGLNGDDQATADELGRINTAVARRMSRGDSLSTALTSDEVGAPTKYGCLVRLGLRGGTWNDALDVSYSVADAASESQYTIRSALYYPAIVGCLAFAGFVAFCLFYVPVLDDVHESMQLPAGVGLTLLRAMRDHLAVWVVAVPLGILIIIWFLSSRRQSRMTSLNGRHGVWHSSSSARVNLACANFTDALARLLEHDVSWNESLRLAACASGDWRLMSAVTEFTAAERANGEPPADTSHLDGWPPFLLWTLQQSQSPSGRLRCLRAAGEVYRASARRRANRLRLVLPVITCTIIGGGITLLYGLALFTPIVDMLCALAL